MFCSYACLSCAVCVTHTSPFLSVSLSRSHSVGCALSVYHSVACAHPHCDMVLLSLLPPPPSSLLLRAHTTHVQKFVKYTVLVLRVLLCCVCQPLYLRCQSVSVFTLLFRIFAISFWLPALSALGCRSHGKRQKPFVYVFECIVHIYFVHFVHGHVI